MVDLESSTPAPPAHEQRRRRFIAAAIVSAAAAIVVVAIAVVALSRHDPDKPDNQQAEAVAESFMNAWVRDDSDAVAALLSPAAFFDGWTPETLPALHDWHQAMGWHYQDEGCEVMSPERVWCEYTADNDLTRAFGTEPVPGSFVLIIDGRIVTSVRDDFNIGAYRDIWTTFSDWVKVHHFADVDRMYALAGGYARVDPVSIGLWKRYTGEFVESGDAYTARARAICTAAHGTYDGLVAPSGRSEAQDAGAAAGVLEEALTELQALPPPTVVKASFDVGFSVIGQLVDAFRRMTTGGQSPVTTANAPPTPADGDLTGILNTIPHLQVGLDRCAINPLR